jgi:hypothetical protein
MLVSTPRCERLETPEADDLNAVRTSMIFWRTTLPKLWNNRAKSAQMPIRAQDAQITLKLAHHALEGNQHCPLSVHNQSCSPRSRPPNCSTSAGARSSTGSRRTRFPTSSCPAATSASHSPACSLRCPAPTEWTRRSVRWMSGSQESATTRRRLPSPISSQQRATSCLLPCCPCCCPIPGSSASRPSPKNGSSTVETHSKNMRPRGFEPLTFGSVDRRSIQLSYGRVAS